MSERRKFPTSVIRAYVTITKWILGGGVIAHIFYFLTGSSFEDHMMAFKGIVTMLCLMYFWLFFIYFFIVSDFPNPNHLTRKDVFFSDEFDAKLNKPRLTIGTLPVKPSKGFLSFFLAGIITVILSPLF